MDARTPKNIADKIRSIDELAEITAQIQANGNVVVLAHGVFDLVHMGHVRHLKAARNEGDILIVTITADKFVAKGPGRPIFSEDMRAEMLAALEYVDWVGVNHNSSAERVLEMLKPDVYVKGSDYENPDDDITGKISTERDAVERHGGKVVFTKDITFSSSALINDYLDVYDAPLKDYLDQVKTQNRAGEIFELIESVRNYRVLIVGDAILDEYQYVQSMGKVSKENIISTRAVERELFAGGVFAAANHVSNLCAQVDVITSLGALDSQTEMIEGSLNDNVKLTPLVRDGVPTTRKCRFVDPDTMAKLFEVYYFEDSPADRLFQSEVDAAIAERAADYDLVLVTDFGHGLIADSTIKILSEEARFLAVNTQTNSANSGFNLITKYPQADYYCIDEPEARLATANQFGEIEEVVSDILPQKVDCDRFIITHGRHGCITFEKSGIPNSIPAFTKSVVDSVGAGDAFLAVTSPLVAAGGPMDLVGFVGNAAGAIKVGIVGHRQSIEKLPLVRYITTLLK